MGRPPWRATARTVQALAAGLAAFGAGALLLLHLLTPLREPLVEVEPPLVRLGPMTASERSGE